MKPSVLEQGWAISDGRKKYKKISSNRRGPIGHFFKNIFSISVAKMGIDWLHFDRKSWLIMKFPFISQGTRDGFSLDTSASRMNRDVGRSKFLKSGRRRTPDKAGPSLSHEPRYQALAKDRIQPRNVIHDPYKEPLISPLKNKFKFILDFPYWQIFSGEVFSREL